MFNYSADVCEAEGDFVTGNNKVAKCQLIKMGVENTPEQTEKN